MKPRHEKLKEYARKLRASMTDAENALWSKIRRKQLKGLQFHRQKVIGNYIVDFYCPKVKVVIECDGGQHYSKVGLKKDALRDDYLKSRGCKVLRFSSREVLKNMEGVLEVVFRNL